MFVRLTYTHCSLAKVGMLALIGLRVMHTGWRLRKTVRVVYSRSLPSAPVRPAFTFLRERCSTSTRLSNRTLLNIGFTRASNVITLSLRGNRNTDVPVDGDRLSAGREILARVYRGGCTVCDRHVPRQDTCRLLRVSLNSFPNGFENTVK